MRRLKDVIKENIIIFLGLAIAIGSLAICTADYFLWFNITAATKINAVILWITSLAIFWYAYEAYQLKLSSSKQTENQEEIMLNEFLPILAPVEKKGQATLKNGNLTNFYIQNFGKGPAKYVEVFISKVKICSDHSISKGEEEEIHVNIEARSSLRELQNQGTPTLNLRIYYEDIYGRKFKTINIKLDQSPKGGYRARKGKWDFKRTDNKNERS